MDRVPPRGSSPAPDTIAAIATPPGAGGIAIVRISGPRAEAVLRAVVGRATGDLEPRRVHHGWARDPTSGRRLDEILFFLLRRPGSYTGEDVAELQGHGGIANAASLLSAALSAGARLAEPGEFTRRAFENGRIDLTRAEAVADIIGAEGERAVQAAQARLSGGVGDAVKALRRDLVDLRADVEAALDFPEEGIEPAGREEVAARAGAIAGRVRRLAEGARAGRLLQQGITVALVGRPNVGKSSLFNALAGEERALVSAEPGTTRDVLEARLAWDGVTVTLWDTAGERPEVASATELERRGMALGRRRAENADVVVLVLDAARASDEWERERARDAGVVAFARGDLVEERPRAPDGAGRMVWTSAVRGDGIESLRATALAASLGELGAAQEQIAAGGEGMLIASERQRLLLEEAAASLGRIGAGLGSELVAVELRQAEARLGAMLGEAVGDAVLDALFARFCIGK